MENNETIQIKNDEYIKKFELKKISMVGLWRWNLKIDTCGICKNNLIDPCISCISSDHSECHIVWGKCNHPYHLHCISGWTKVRDVCPLCSELWEIMGVG